MSVRLENGAVLRADYGTSTQRVSNLPVSVQCWLFVPGTALPSAGAYWPIWTLGQPDTQNYLALEAHRGTAAGTIELVAAFDGGARVTSGLDDLARDAWHLVTVVLVATGQGGDAQLRLYVDDQAVVKQTGAQGSLSPSGWTLFLLGEALEQQGTPEDPTAHVEHPAIWRDELQDGTPQTSDAGKMYADKIPPWQADTRLSSGVGRPDFGYWFLTAHSRSGLRVRNEQTREDRGELWNQAKTDQSPDLPNMEWVDSPSNAIWSARTPILRWVYDQPITPDERPPFVAPSRLQPAFFVVNDNAELATAQEIRALPIYSDPNITKVFGGDVLSTEDVVPKYLGVTIEYVPFKDVSLTAKRCADFIEMQGFTAGRGVGPGNRYAGALQIRGTGNAGIKGGVLRGYDRGDFRDTPTAADTIPLELNIADWVDPGSTANDYVLRPWHTWYRANGVALLAEYMDHLWAALKQELDDRDLCYPLRAHMDYETIPRENQHLRLDKINFGGQEVEIQTGTWPKILADTTRYQNEVLAYAYDSSGAEITRTLQQLAPPGYDATKAFYDQSQAFIDWWWNWSYVTRVQAAADSIFKTLNTYFEQTRWSNYWCFAADNPDYPYVQSWDDRAFNSAPEGVIRGDFSAPVLYSSAAWVDRIRGEHGGRIGYTVPESVRDVSKMRIDACVNSTRSLPLAPYFEDPFRRLDYGAEPRNDSYQFVEEDLREVYAYAWQRGVDEYLLFTFNFPPEPGGTEPDGVPFEGLVRSASVAQWLRDTVQATAQYHQDHAARTGRLARRAM